RPTSRRGSSTACWPASRTSRPPSSDPSGPGSPLLACRSTAHPWADDRCTGRRWMAQDLSALGRDEHELLARIARRPYVDGHTQVQISAEFCLSRPKVQRMRERARSTGVVTVHIDPPPGLDLQLEAELEREFGLVQ